MQKIRAECDSGQGRMRQWSPRIWCLFVLWGTFKYLWLLWSTYWYFEVFFGTSGYFEVLLGILRYFWVLWGTFGYFEVLLGVSEKVFQSLGPDPFCHQQHHHYHHYCVWRSCLSHVLGPLHFIWWIESKYKPSTHQELCYLNFDLTNWVQEKSC